MYRIPINMSTAHPPMLGGRVGRPLRGVPVPSISAEMSSHAFAKSQIGKGFVKASIFSPVMFASFPDSSKRSLNLSSPPGIFVATAPAVFKRVGPGRTTTVPSISAAALLIAAPPHPLS